MTSFTILMIIVAVLLIVLRRKIGWGSFALGVVVAFLLLGTPIGEPISRGMESVADTLQQGITSLFSVF